MLESHSSAVETRILA